MNKLVTFKKMHEQGDLLLLPNAWDVLSAIVLEQSGYKAIGTTSWGISNSMGYKDGESIEFKELIKLVRKILAAVNIPVTVDIESGYGKTPELVADNVLELADIGVVGINIEDSFKNAIGLVDKETQSVLIGTIRKKLDDNGYKDFFINARIDTYFQLKKPLQETIERAVSYVCKGADGIFVPGLNQSSEIKEVAKAIDAPLNLMSLPNLTNIDTLYELGVKRFSLGNSLSDATTAFIEQRAREILSSKNTASLYDNSGVKTEFR
jgi:2-methylisocitrate lyase-like PEP mutase family enzyme